MRLISASLVCIAALALVCRASAPTTKPATAPATAAASAPAPDEARRLKAIAEIANIKTALDAFEVDTGRYPTTAEGFAALLKAPEATRPNWAGPYLAKLPVDPWGNSYAYQGADATANEPDILSAGPDGKFGTPDDLNRFTKAPAKAPVVRPAAEQTARALTLASISNLKTALETFEIDNGRYPTTAEGLAALLKSPSDVKTTWHGPYIDKLPVDGWNHPLVYRGPDVVPANDFDLVSFGPDGILGTADDLNRSTKP